VDSLSTPPVTVWAPAEEWARVRGRRKIVFIPDTTSTSHERLNTSKAIMLSHRGVRTYVHEPTFQGGVTGQRRVRDPLGRWTRNIVPCEPCSRQIGEARKVCLH
jgi:hypothetical protein